MYNFYRYFTKFAFGALLFSGVLLWSQISSAKIGKGTHPSRRLLSQKAVRMVFAHHAHLTRRRHLLDNYHLSSPETVHIPENSDMHSALTDPFLILNVPSGMTEGVPEKTIDKIFSHLSTESGSDSHKSKD